MANTKTQKPLTISNMKSENIVEFFVEISHWKKIADKLDQKKTWVYKYKKNLKSVAEEKNAFEALAETFTLREINLIIEMFNDYIERPEDFQIRKKKQEVDLEEQAKTIEKHMKDMDLKYKNDNSDFEFPKNMKSTPEDIRKFWENEKNKDED
ncbi:hypothetical protein K2V74_14120 [Mammaliicoccus sciuri]|uniref:hypothetical protein n=1 Tax=Mammaliicoccus sciuri TaxID=1296 RepID=UPI001E5F4B03|nr:hypothetical protein [Mammaliicoccus sciuri]MCD8875455.1 hypothetical protein [Mammaliicoccus sciuri]